MLRDNEGWPRVRPLRKERPLGIRTPRVWSIEPAFGCNLVCAHCCNDLIPKDRYRLIDLPTWTSAFSILNEVSPTVRVDLCGYVGEPTLHDRLLDLLPIARRLAPRAQIQITTNGTMLQTGRYSFGDLLDAGANVVYTDQYGKPETFERLARISGYPYYRYYDRTVDDERPSPWRYYGPHLKLIVLMDPPSRWPKTRLRAGLLGNWYGNLNFDRAKRFGMAPLASPLSRRCNQPFLYVTVAASGSYLLCCQDGLQTTAGKFGDVSSGVEGFIRFWFGRELQTVRRRLRAKDRASTEYACAKCNITFSRCDYLHWSEEDLANYYDGLGDTGWHSLDEEPTP